MLLMIVFVFDPRQKMSGAHFYFSSFFNSNYAGILDKKLTVFEVDF